MIRRVQGLRAVAHIMPHDAHHVENIGLRIGDLLGRAELCHHFQITETRAQPPKVFCDRPRREARPLARVVRIFRGVDRGKLVRIRGSARRELHDELKAKRRERRQIEPRIRELLEVAEMIRPTSTRMLHREIGRIAPAIRFSAEKHHPLHRPRLTHKRREIRRQRFQRELVHRPVPVIVPRVQHSRGEQGRHKGEPGAWFHGEFDGAGRGRVAGGTGDFGRTDSSVAA